MNGREYYRLKPDAPGQMGDKTVLNNQMHPPQVSHFQFVFDDWFGDDLIECFPCFMMTERLLNAIEGLSLKGYEIKDVEMEFSPIFYELNGSKNVPNFKWLYINGSPEDDFYIDEEHCLVVSSLAYEQIKGNVNNCEVEVLSVRQM